MPYSLCSAPSPLHTYTVESLISCHWGAVLAVKALREPSSSNMCVRCDVGVWKGRGLGCRCGGTNKRCCVASWKGKCGHHLECKADGPMNWFWGCNTLCRVNCSDEGMQLCPGAALLTSEIFSALVPYWTLQTGSGTLPWALFVCFHSVLLVRTLGLALCLGVSLLGFPAVVCAVTPIPNISSLCNTHASLYDSFRKQQQIIVGTDRTP